jgi:hypothetical protein
MYKCVIIFIVLAFTFAVGADTDCSVKLREGYIKRLENFVKVKQLISIDEKPVEIKSISAKEDSQFAVLTIKLVADKSLGLYDYALVEEGEDTEFKTIGMSVNNGTFQKGIWEVRSKGKIEVRAREGSQAIEPGSVVKLLFEVPSGNKRFKLISRLFDKAMTKEYGVTRILDFEDMSKKVFVRINEAKSDKAPKLE